MTALAGRIEGERPEREPVNYAPETILTVEQVAEWLQLSASTVEKLPIKSGYIGNRRRYLAAHVIEWFNAIART